MQTIACPPPDQLKAYLSGKLDDATSDSLAQHLLDCRSCEGTAIQFEQEPDTLVELLKIELPQPESQSESRPEQPPESLPNQPAASRGCEMLLMPVTIGHYELLQRLGTGGMGAVYLARHMRLEKQVAIKLLPALPAQNPEFVARFQREMRAAGKLDHPAIVRTTDAGEQQGVYFLVMDAIDGLDLGRIARAEEKLSLSDACEITRQAALGLAHAHEKGIVHRDVKPSNLMLDTEGKIRILDFGLAQIGFWEAGSAEITSVGQLMGTLDYMAPEQAERGGAVDYRADLYSLGSTLFRLLTGRAPLAAAPNLTPLEKLRLLATHKPPKLRSMRPDVPEALGQIVDSMLAREPSGRPASATHAAELLAPFAAQADLVGLLKRARSKPVVEETSFSFNPFLQPAWHGEPAPHATSPNSGSNSVAQGRAPAGTTGSLWFLNWETWLGLAACGAMICAGIWLVIETSQGQLVIDSEADVQVKLLAVDEAGNRAQVDQLHIVPGAKSTRLRSGKYEITLGTASDAFGLTNGSFTIRNGQTVVATITQKQPQTDAAAPELKADAQPADPRLNQIVFDNETLDTWLGRLKFERNPQEIERVLTAIGALASEELGDIIRQPLTEFVLRDTKGEYHQPAVLALLKSTGATFHTTVAQSLAGLENERVRIEFLRLSIRPLFEKGFSDVESAAPFLAEANKLLTSNSPEIAIEAATLLRSLTCEHPEKRIAPEVQQSLIAMFAAAPSVTNENFWLAFPGKDYDLTLPSLLTANSRGWSSKTSPAIHAEIFQRAVSVLVESTSFDKVTTQASIVLRTLVGMGAELSESERDQLAKVLANSIAHAAEDPSICATEVELPSVFVSYVVPLIPFYQFEPGSGQGKTIPAYPMIQNMNLVQAMNLQDRLQPELAKLFNMLHGMPLHGEVYSQIFRGPGRADWNEFSSVRTFRSNDNSTPIRVIYLQAGAMLGKSQDELLSRFNQKLPADWTREIDNELDMLVAAPQTRAVSVIDKLSKLPIESSPRAAQVLDNLFAGGPLGRGHHWRADFLSVWMKATGDNFQASYTRALQNTTDEKQLVQLLEMDLPSFPEFRCTQPAALEGLLTWCDQIMERPSNTQSDELQRNVIYLLTRLTTDKECVSVQCQQMVVDRLQAYSGLQKFSFLSNQDYWLVSRIEGSYSRQPTAAPWGRPMREARLRRAFEVIASKNESEYVPLCQALALVRDGLNYWDVVPQELQQRAVDHMALLLDAAVQDPSSQAQVVAASSELWPVAYPTFGHSYRLTWSAEPDRTGGPIAPQFNAIVLLLNLLISTTENSQPELLEKLRPKIQGLHDSVEELKLTNPDLSEWGRVDWGSMVLRSTPKRSTTMRPSNRTELISHTWYMQSGVLLGKDLDVVRQRPNQLYTEERERKRRFVQPGDTLAIHIPGLLPQSGDPPVIQAGTSAPVIGFPVPVSQEGNIQLPELEPLTVRDLELPQVQEQIESQYVTRNFFKSGSPLGITVQFLLRAGAGVELRNIAGNAPVTIPTK